MVQTRKNASHHDTMDSQSWLAYLAEEHQYEPNDIIRQSCILSELTGQGHATETGHSCFQQGLDMANILADISADPETIAAALIYNCTQYADLGYEDLTEQLGEPIAKLVAGVERMNDIHNIQTLGSHKQTQQQVDNLRKMLLAMVDDPRVVLIKLAERLSILHRASHLSAQRQESLSKEAMHIYAPLSNRLGVGQIKWEMEDLAFRYLEPERYKAIAKDLNEKRLDRDRFVKQITAELTALLKKVGIDKAAVYGRSKHIHSIYRKMQRKHIPLEQIYDSTAVRILVDNIEQCYQALGIVQSQWEQIPAEFDDYISNPKSNGYQSLHTAVISDNGKHFEVQIRTQQMHDEAELGIAAHWKYKEGGGKVDSHEQRINWLRDVLAWHHEVASQEGVPEKVESDFLEDRVYVFTPNGDVVDLPKGATPLDFAYQIHSQVGHRCRGAKADGHIINLTQPLVTGQTVEVLTSKAPKPSRDWLNPHLGYLATTRAKAKVHHWFKLLDFDKNLAEGRTIVEREFTKLDLHEKDHDLEKIAHSFNFKKTDDLYAAVGRGDIRVNQLVGRITPHQKHKVTVEDFTTTATDTVSGEDVYVAGVGNLLTNMAKCCHPVPGDAIIGYITLGKGISIHRQDCNNILHLEAGHRPRLIEVSWQQQTQQYPVDIAIKAYDRSGLLKDITTVISNESANVLGLSSQTDSKEHLTHIKMTVELGNLTALSRLMDKIKQLNNVVEIHRVN